MLLRTIGALIKAPAHHLKHPKFEHFDRAVTLLVAIDLVPRLHEMWHFVIMPLKFLKAWWSR